VIQPRRPAFLFCGLAVLAAALHGPAARAGEQLVASDADLDDGFGSMMVLEGDTLVVGAMDADTEAGEDAGAVYVFGLVGGSWVEQARLVAADGVAEDRFGNSLALAGDTLLVSASSADLGAFSNAGAVYVFVRRGGTWTQEAKLLPPVTETNAWFGDALALQGDTAVVGAGQVDLAGSLAGAVFVFQRSRGTWSLAATLTAPDAEPTDRFGSAVALAGDTLLVGTTWGDSPIEDDSGSAYVFVGGGGSWAFSQKLFAPEPAGNDFFGTRIALEGDTALIAARSDDVGTVISAGSAHVFVRDGGTWIHQAQLSASDATAVATLGDAMALDGDRVLLGAKGDDAAGLNSSGSAYLFERVGTAWHQVDKLSSPLPTALQDFGGAVALSGDMLLVSDDSDDLAGPASSGAVFVQDLAEVTLPWADIGYALPGEDGPPRLEGSGTLLPGTTVVISLGNAAPLLRAAMLLSTTQALLPYKGGTLVPGLDLLVVSFKTDAQGAWSAAATWPAGLPPGTVYSIQFAILDPSGPLGATLSNALEATTP
jgi:hypothetical protein